MQSLSIANKFLPGILFLLLATFAPLPPCVAVTIEEIYDDDDGEGFKDETDLAQAEKTFLAARGNDAETLGEARKKAFEHATSILESRMTNSNTIRISVEFVIFPGQEDPNDPDKCGQITEGTYTVASASPRGYGYPGDRLDEGDTNNPGLGTAYPYALFEALSGQELNGQNADIGIDFSKCVPFYYGFTESAPANEIDFVHISLHEIMHGLGFLEQIRPTGDFPVRTITVTGTQNGIPFTRQATIESRAIYDEQLYSETYSDLLINLSSSQRAEAITSEDGLLWEGTDGGRNDCSYGQRMAELKYDSAKAQDGKPRLHAPSTYEPSGSVSHVHANAKDLMEAFVPSPRNMDLTLGMLKDMGWSVSADGFPSHCEASGIAVTPETGLVTSEGGAEAKFEVELESEPEKNVVISVESDKPTEGVVTDPQTSELTFTPSDWDTPQEVTVMGVDDTLQDGPQNYFVELKADSDDRFYAVLDPKFVYLRNEDNDQPPPPPPPPPSPEVEVTVSFGSSSYSVTEGGTVAVRVILSADPERTVTIPITIGQATTAGADDYSLSSASVTFSSGETSKNFILTPTDDNVDDDGEVVVLAFGALPQRVFGGARTSATVTIRDINLPQLGAEAGENRTVAQREEVILKGSATSAASGEPTYRWAYTGARNDIELRTPDAATCSFMAPSGLNEDTVLVFRLIVTDSRGRSAEDTVSITVTGQKVAFSSKDKGGTITLGDGSTVELTVNRDAGSPPGDPVIILSSNLVEDIDWITFHVSADLPEAPPSGFRLEGFAVDIDLGVQLGEGETVTVCLPAPQGTQNPALYHYDEDSGAWERLESRSETVDGVRSVCAEAGVFSLFGVFVAERSEPPVNPPPTGGGTQGGGGCAVAAGADHGTESAAVNLLLFITVLFSVFFRKSRLTT